LKKEIKGLKDNVDSTWHSDRISGSNIHGLCVDSKGELEMISYWLGINAYRQGNFKNPFTYASQDWRDWNEGWYAALYQEKGYKPKYIGERR